jgi:5-methylcytosine-specific restriction enzyme A
MKPRRQFSPATYARIVLRQCGRCACGCGEKLQPGQIDFDHEVSRWLGGADTEENLRALIKKHHLKKTKDEATIRAKNDRVKAKYEGKRLNARDREIARIIERRRPA